MNIWTICLCILALVTFLSRCWIKIFRKLNILDKPWKDLKWTRKPVPTMQWIVVYLIFLIIVSLFFPDMRTNRLMLWFLAWGTLIVIVEIITELEYIWKIKFKTAPRGYRQRQAVCHRGHWWCRHIPGAQKKSRGERSGSRGASSQSRGGRRKQAAEVRDGRSRDPSCTARAWTCKRHGKFRWR